MEVVVVRGLINHYIYNIFCIFLLLVDGQTCIESVDLNQGGRNRMTHGRLGICPELDFHCNVRISRIGVRMYYERFKKDYPYIQIWRPQGSEVYSKINSIQVVQNHMVWSPYILADIPLTGKNRMLAQSGDVIGYYHSPAASLKVETIHTPGYFLYQFNEDGRTVSSVNLNRALVRYTPRQPIMKFEYGKRSKVVCCYILNSYA